MDIFAKAKQALFTATTSDLLMTDMTKFPVKLLEEKKKKVQKVAATYAVPE